MDIDRLKTIRIETESTNRGENFDTKLELLKQEEASNEFAGLREAKKIRDHYRSLLVKKSLGNGLGLDSIFEMPADMVGEMKQQLESIDIKYTEDGVHFLKCQFSKIVDALRQGKRVEFEGFGPYLVDYIFKDMGSDGVELTAPDAVGLAVMKFLKELFPELKAVSLYDEYNIYKTASDVTGRPRQQNQMGSLLLEEGGAVASERMKADFKKFIEVILLKYGIIEEGDQEGPNADYVLISETDKIKDAEKLVNILEGKGLVVFGEGKEAWFQNNVQGCDDPRYLRIKLRDKNGKWECACLDASGFLDPRNREIVHLVMLPRIPFEEQQDKVWEILNALGFRPENYHNIFFDVRNTESVENKSRAEEIRKSNITPEMAVAALESKLKVLL